MILVTQVCCSRQLILGIATLVGIVGAVTLLFLTFLIGAGFTFYLPAQQASINELVSRDELPRAVALGCRGVQRRARARSRARGRDRGVASSGSALMAARSSSSLMFVAMSA